MMYHQSFCAVVKVNGRVLREVNGDVLLPFQSEYSILLKNLESRRAVVDVSIDGVDVLYGKQLVINGNSELELERFLSDLNTGQRFKFIEKTAQIENHRGNRVDDGVIRVAWKYEVALPQYVATTQLQYGYPKDLTWTCSSAAYASSVSTRSLDGITVGGSTSQQSFSTTTTRQLELEEHVMCLHLCGVVSNQVVAAPLTTRTKVKCVTCGRASKSTVRFCPDCGTALTWRG